MCLDISFYACLIFLYEETKSNLKVCQLPKRNQAIAFLEKHPWPTTKILIYWEELKTVGHTTQL